MHKEINAIIYNFRYIQAPASTQAVATLMELSSPRYIQSTTGPFISRPQILRHGQTQIKPRQAVRYHGAKGKISLFRSTKQTLLLWSKLTFTTDKIWKNVWCWRNGCLQDWKRWAMKTLDLRFQRQNWQTFAHVTNFQSNSIPWLTWQHF